MPGVRRQFDPSKWEEGIRRSQQSLIRYHAIGKAVWAEIHRFAFASHHRFAFSELAAAIFDTHKAEVDKIPREAAPEAIEKIPAICDRLAAGASDSEALSQAMASCRRMIAAFADAVLPVETAGAVSGEHATTQDKYLNRIEKYVRDHCESESRRERLIKTLRLLHDRVSAGLKADITREEAQVLFVWTYLVLGEIATLR